MIKIEDFAKLQIKIGEILEAEKVQDADKLIKLQIDLGEEKPRQGLAGIAEFFPEPQALVGKQIPVLSNLEPRTLRGYESNGMILAVSGDAGVTMLNPKKRVPNGSLVK